ncbi:hypothetical protein [Nocardia pseudobrasiliensis]|uniref:hypothetical protein n=2 Tax=Nocardia pseudobrasiliensis TaxID=45979 RepID=UPI001FE57BCB|nr:hypothetical protein [Nocardia pseudobrasiliensis]
MARRQLVNSGAPRRALIVGAIPLALAVACSNGPDGPVVVRGGAPTVENIRPGSSTPSPVEPAPAPGGDHVAPTPAGPVQPGVTATPRHPGPAQPGVTTPAVPAPLVPEYVAPQSFRAVPTPQTAPAIDWQALHAPTPVAPVAPIAPPPRTLRVGAFTTAVPDDITDNVLTPVNFAAAETEAAIATGLNSVGINATRSDKIAGLTVAGAAGGAALGAAAAGLPAAAIGAVPGAIIGTGVGAVTGAIIGGIAGAPVGASAPSAAGGALIGAGVGVLAGAAIGAAVLGVPAAVAGGIAGGVIGGAAGTAFGAAV